MELEEGVCTATALESHTAPLATGCVTFAEMLNLSEPQLLLRPEQM